MKSMQDFTNLAPVSTTISFEARPIGATRANMGKNGLIKDDQQLKKTAFAVKGLMDESYRDFISAALTKITLDKDALRQIMDLLFTRKRSESQNKKKQDLEEKLMKSISSQMKKDEDYASLTPKDLIKSKLPEKYKDDQEKAAALSEVKGFATYFRDFNENRQLIFSGDGQHGSIAYRCIKDNLPIYINNIRIYTNFVDHLPDNTRQELSDAMKEIGCNDIGMLFLIDTYEKCLTQEAIDIYNTVLGGYTKEDGTKIKGINEYINEYNVQQNKLENGHKIPFMKQLRKQILCGEKTFSRVYATIDSDEEALTILKVTYLGEDENDGTLNSIKKLDALVKGMDGIDQSKVFLKSDSVSWLSMKINGNPMLIKNAYYEQYDSAHPRKTKNYEENREKDYKQNGEFSIEELSALASKGTGSPVNVLGILKENLIKLIKEAQNAYKYAATLIEAPYTDKRPLSRNDDACRKLSTLTRATNTLMKGLKNFQFMNDSESIDVSFYEALGSILESMWQVNTVTNKLNTYLSKKLKDKVDTIPMTFHNSTLMAGYDANKVNENGCVLMERDGKYYIIIKDKENDIDLSSIPSSDSENAYHLMRYKFLDIVKQMPRCAFGKTSAYREHPKYERAKAAYDKSKADKKTPLSFEEELDIIEYYKGYIENHGEGWEEFDIKFREASSYESLRDFLSDINRQCYGVSFSNVDPEYIDRQVEEGNLYMFQIYTKDFSEHSKGTKNLHTLYFLQLFSKENLENPRFRLCGGSRLQYREKVIDPNRAFSHEKGSPIENKTPDENGKKGYFTPKYTITKDRRYTREMFKVSFTLKINVNSQNITNISSQVQDMIKENKGVKIIGIDRGERNLLYICLMDENGKVLDMRAINGRTSVVNGKKREVNYRDKMKAIGDMDKTAQIENTQRVSVKDLRDTFIQDVAAEIAKIAAENNAIVVIEDLSIGFKNSRQKIPNQAYQLFETFIVRKLGYLVTDKTRNPYLVGGYATGYQLASEGIDLEKYKQNGILFVVNPWMTSKTDPVTGFIPLFNFNYRNMDDAKSLVSRIRNIRYDKDMDMFVFTLCFNDFPSYTEDERVWDIWTYRNRFENIYHKETHTSECREVFLTKEFRALFEKYGIGINGNIKQQIIDLANKPFMNAFFKLLNLTMQVRNNRKEDNMDFIISPIMGKDGKFFDSREYYGKEHPELPQDADANGAYNIARKGLILLDRIRHPDGNGKVSLKISNKDWINYVS